jgi:hypothetical protein
MRVHDVPGNLLRALSFAAAAPASELSTYK